MPRFVSQKDFNFFQHINRELVPDAKWVGVWATDIEKYKLPTIPMTEADIKRCYDLQSSSGTWCLSSGINDN